MLSQKNDQNIEVPISFESSTLQGEELNYTDVEKQAYAVFKSIKHFKPFLIKSHTKVMVSHPLIKIFLIQKDLGDKRENWVTTLQEYDLEIKPTKIVRGQGLCKLLTETIDTTSENVDKVNIIEDIKKIYVTQIGRAHV